MTKVLFCTNGMTLGGAERVIANLSNYLSSKNISVTILILNGNKSEYKLNSKVSFATLDFCAGKNIFSKVSKIITNLKKYLDFLDNSQPDVVISFLPRACYYSAIACKIKKIKLIMSERNDPHTKYSNPIKKNITKFLYSLADKIVFQTNGAKLFFGKKIQKKSVIIANPINDDFFKKKRSSKVKNKIITFGRLVDQKNHALLINAFELFSKKNKNYQLYIYGEGENRTYLETIINAKKMKKSVFLPGKTDDIISEITDAEIFVLSSNYEGMPNALMEAMALGIPCISTDCPCGGPKELIEHDVDGLLVPVNDVYSLASALNKLVNDPNKRLKFSKNSINKMRKYKGEIINKEWEEIISEVKGK